MRFFDDGFGVDDERAAEEHQRNGNEQGRFVNGGEKRFQVEADGIAARHQIDARSETALLVIKILY